MDKVIIYQVDEKYHLNLIKVPRKKLQRGIGNFAPEFALTLTSLGSKKPMFGSPTK
jgi:hypothetical protein